MKEQQEQLWIDAARQGDQEAFGELVRQYEKQVMALTLRMCKNPRRRFLLLGRDWETFGGRAVSPPGCTVWPPTPV